MAFAHHCGDVLEWGSMINIRGPGRGPLESSGGREKRQGSGFFGERHPHESLEHGNLLVVDATAKQLPPLSLPDALELTLLIGRKDPRRGYRVLAAHIATVAK
jgi:hypothetical protein